MTLTNHGDRNAAPLKRVQHGLALSTLLLLVIDDHQHPKDYAGPHLFTDPDGEASTTAARPSPYRLSEQVTLRNLTTTSGRKLRLSPDTAFAASLRVIERN